MCLYTTVGNSEKFTLYLNCIIPVRNFKTSFKIENNNEYGRTFGIQKDNYVENCKQNVEQIFLLKTA